MFDKLWNKEGLDRLLEIDNMKLSDYDKICENTKECPKCPLALLYRDANGYSRLLCVDVATRTRVIKAMKNGGRFLKKGEKLGDEK